MNLLLYVELSDTVPFTYQNSIFEKAQTRLPGIMVYDCDNHSEPITVRYAVDLLSQADKSVVVVKAGAGRLGNLRPLFEQFWQSAANRLVVCEGENPVVEKMLGLLPPETLLKGIADDYFDRIAEYLGG